MVHLQDTGAVNFWSQVDQSRKGGNQGTKTNMYFHLTCECLSDWANKGWG